MKTLVEFITEMSGSDKQAATSHLSRIIEHKLKLEYATERDLQENERLWRQSLAEQIRQVEEIVASAPGVKPFIAASDLMKPFRQAIKRIDPRILRKPLPRTCPYTLEQVVGPRLFRSLA